MRRFGHGLLLVQIEPTARTGSSAKSIPRDRAFTGTDQHGQAAENHEGEDREEQEKDGRWREDEHQTDRQEKQADVQEEHGNRVPLVQ